MLRQCAQLLVSRIHSWYSKYSNYIPSLFFPPFLLLCRAFQIFLKIMWLLFLSLPQVCICCLVIYLLLQIKHTQKLKLHKCRSLLICPWSEYAQSLLTRLCVFWVAYRFKYDASFVDFARWIKTQQL